MPKPKNPPSLRLFGPDTKYGARKAKGYTRYMWFIVEDRNTRHATGFEKDDAEAANASLNKFIERKKRPGDNSMLLSVALDTYRATLSGKPCKDFASTAQWINAHWDQRTVGEVTRAQCKLYVERRQAGGAANSTIIKELLIVRTACRIGGVFLDLKKRPDDKFVMPKPADPRTIWHTPKQIASLLRTCRHSDQFHLAVYVLLTVYFACRREALLTMRFEPSKLGGYFDLDRKVADFNPAGRAQNNKRRPLTAIPGPAMWILRAAKRRSKSGYVIEVDGKPIKSIKTSWKNACANSIGEGHRPHDLCHTSVSWMLQGGASIFAVSKRVKKSVSTIERVYGHVVPSEPTRINRRHQRRWL